MILQALYQLYDDLVKRGEIDRPGWGKTGISWALCINESGEVEQVIPQAEEVKGQKKPQPRQFSLPAPVKRTVGIASNFLYDNSSYLLGVDGKGKPKRSKECFLACRALHSQLLAGLGCPEATAILNYFDHWKPEQAATHPALAENFEKVIAEGNLLFRINGRFVQDVPEIRQAWQSYYDKEAGERRQCLVSGEEDVILPVHPAIKGVNGAQPTGAALVSFNAYAFCSYGRWNQQGMNAPVGKSAAFAYTSALNHLLADRKHVRTIGDATVVCWAAGAEPVYEDLFSFSVFDDIPEGVTEADLQAAVNRLANFEYCEELHADPNCPFYILGLSPNAARLSVRFFYRDTFGNLMKNINAHHDRMRIVKPSYEKFDRIPLWAMLRETVNLNSRDKAPSPVMAGAAARAVFTGGLYPAALLQNTMVRIRAERNITYGRAAILKAYYLRNEHPDCPKEVLTVALNEASTNVPYTLGRLFSVYEAVQQAANPGIKSTIKDKYFNSASTTPGTIFPILDNLCAKHLRKLETGQRIWYEQQIMKLADVLGEEYPVRFSLAQQGSFNLGYYHQTQKRYEKKEDQ